jgi:DNA repair protein RadC
MIPEITMKVSYSKDVKKSSLVQIKSSKDAYDLLMNIYNQDTFDWTEEMILLCFNRANKCVGFYKVSSGGTAGTICDPKVIFTIALNCGAHAIMLSHNHPSGLLEPSPPDRQITTKLRDGGALLDIKLLDHIIVTSDGYYSFNDNDLI